MTQSEKNTTQSEILPETTNGISTNMLELGTLMYFTVLKGRQKFSFTSPIVGKYKNYKVISMPPPSSGGVALMALLQSVEKYPLAKWGFQHDSTVRAMVEATKAARQPQAMKASSGIMVKSAISPPPPMELGWTIFSSSRSECRARA